MQSQLAYLLTGKPHPLPFYFEPPPLTPLQEKQIAAARAMNVVRREKTFARLTSHMELLGEKGGTAEEIAKALGLHPDYVRKFVKQCESAERVEGTYPHRWRIVK